MNEKRIRQIFVVSVILKGIDAGVETLAGLALALISGAQIVALAHLVTRHELVEDPNDLVANWLLHTALTLPVSSKTFFAYYMVSHGVIKLVMVAGLLANRLWAYPFGIVVMVGFIAYQLYAFTLSHAPSMLVLTAFDMFVLWLVWHEYRLVRARTGKN